MKVIYSKKITEQLLETKKEADKQNKTIDYVELTEEEARQLYRELERSCCTPVIMSWRSINGMTFCGITLKVKQ